MDKNNLELKKKNPTSPSKSCWNIWPDLGSTWAEWDSLLLFLFALCVGSIFYALIVSIYWRKQWHPTPVLLPGKPHGRRSLVGCSPWGRWGSDTTERLHFHFSLSCIGEGNGNPLQCSCLENPRDGGAWWAAVYGVTQSRTRLKWLSSSSSSIYGGGKRSRNSRWNSYK